MSESETHLSGFENSRTSMEPEWVGLPAGTGHPTPGASEPATIGGGALRGLGGVGEDEQKKRERLER